MDARALSRLFALGLAVAVSPLLGCDRVNDSDGDGDAGALDVDAVGQVWCQHQWDCYNSTIAPEYTVDMCIAEWDDTFAYYAATDDEACAQGQLDYYACLSALECGALADYYEGEDQPGTEPPCNLEANALEDLCGSDFTEPDPGTP